MLQKKNNRKWWLLGSGLQWESKSIAVQLSDQRVELREFLPVEIPVYLPCQKFSCDGNQFFRKNGLQIFLQKYFTGTLFAKRVFFRKMFQQRYFLSSQLDVLSIPLRENLIIPVPVKHQRPAFRLFFAIVF